MSEAFKKIPLDDLYGTRLLVFLEDEPQSNMYRQILLNKEAFKKVSMAIGKVVEKDGTDETVEYSASDEIYKLPDLQEIHDVVQ